MFGEALVRVRERAPLIHCITNYVTANDCANLLLACGASPIMSDSPDEVGEVVSLCGGLLLNLGTLNRERLRAMLVAGKRANERGIAVVVDPVGAGSSSARTEAARTLLREIRVSAIRSNLSELRAILGIAAPTRGVDNDPNEREDDLAETLGEMSRLAVRLGAVVAVTGATDLVTDGRKTYKIKNGDPLLRRVTGAGCQLSALTAAFLAANPETPLKAAAAAVAAMGVCGEIAAERMTEADGNASYRNYVIDAAYRLTAKALDGRARAEFF
ncbi:MAG: hydroxyethylthiazole kinase [Bacteroides sp.]|nr:hydroxyethylthiazole kinase [Roseburia sp.]MCM1461326.1 hydroxyethylthiazole kinase [Bacteroides sp.]